MPGAAAVSGGLQAAADGLLAQRARTLRPPDGARLIDICRIHMMAYGVGAILGLAALSLEERTAKCRVAAAVLGIYPFI